MFSNCSPSAAVKLLSSVTCDIPIVLLVRVWVPVSVTRVPLKPLNKLISVPVAVIAVLPKVIFPTVILLEPRVTSSVIEIAFPSEDRMFLPALICIGASNSIWPVPLEVNVISPFAVSNVIVSFAVSNIFVDSPASVWIVKSVPSVESTWIPLMYNEPED